jgi:hypothetical protein
MYQLNHFTPNPKNGVVRGLNIQGFTRRLEFCRLLNTDRVQITPKYEIQPCTSHMLEICVSSQRCGKGCGCKRKKLA